MLASGSPCEHSADAMPVMWQKIGIIGSECAFPVHLFTAITHTYFFHTLGLIIIKHLDVVI